MKGTYLARYQPGQRAHGGQKHRLRAPSEGELALPRSDHLNLRVACPVFGETHDEFGEGVLHGRAAGVLALVESLAEGNSGAEIAQTAVRRRARSSLISSRRRQVGQVEAASPKRRLVPVRPARLDCVPKVVLRLLVLVVFGIGREPQEAPTQENTSRWKCICGNALGGRLGLGRAQSLHAGQ